MDISILAYVIYDIMHITLTSSCVNETEQNVPSVLTPSSSINRKKAAMPIAAGPPSGTTSQHAPVSHSPKEG